MKRLSKGTPVLLLLALLLAAGCSGPRAEHARDLTAEAPTDRTIRLVLLQCNDVYEITPIQGGRWGGLARVATLRRRLLEENPNTLTVLAGDFFSPSALGTARVDGDRLAGRQMVDVLNTMGLDYATFGNHEFDLSKEQFYQRLSESQFKYISSNVFDEHGDPFPGVSSHAVVKIPGLPGDTLRVGLVGVTLGSNTKDYVRYTDPIEAVKREAARLAGRTDALVALTHLALDQDVHLAAEVPELDLILGGHEHENIQVLRGPRPTPIAKADANARSVYVHRLTFDPSRGALHTTSDIALITPALEDDPETARVVDRWVGVAFDGFRSQGLRPAEPVVTLTEPLDGLESSVRNHPTALTDLIAGALLHAAPEAEASIFNSGSIRVDDVLQPGTLIEYDVIRILPFGGQVVTVDMKGSLLDSTLTQGLKNRGTGGFLHHAGITQDAEGWRIQGRPLDKERTYHVALSDFLITGRETHLAFLSPANPNLRNVEEHGDIRLAVIAELKRAYP